MKVEKFKNPSMFWLPTGTCCRNLVILKIHRCIPEIWLFLEADFRDKSHCPPEEKRAGIFLKKNTSTK